MKIALSLLISLLLVSCLQKKSVEPTYIVKYGNKEVHTAEFINKMMTLGFVKYGKSFYSKIYDQQFFEQMRSETLEHTLNSILMSDLSKKLELKVTSKDVQSWIVERAPTYSKEDLILTLQANNLTYKDWSDLFREQLVQHKISQKLMVEDNNKNQPPEKKKAKQKAKKAKQKAKKATHYKIAVLTYENQLDADQAYKQVSGSKEKFNRALKNLQGSEQYSWLLKEQIPFFSNIKRLKKGRVSKPFETDWGFLLVRLEKKEKRTKQLKIKAPELISNELKSIVEDFKNDPKLQINSDLLYSLKIRK